MALLASLLFIGAAPSATARNGQPGTPTHELRPADDHLLDEMQKAAFLFFEEQSHPDTYLVRDRARADGSPSEGKASVAASGFAFTAWAIATERGWTERATALDHVRNALRFLVEKAPRQEGFFYHFMEMDSGARAWNCELSSVDTSLAIAGAIVAREYFADRGITALVNQLVDDLDWIWFRNGGNLIALGWHDEHGFSRYRWNRYSEHVLMSFLSLGSSLHPVESEYWMSWERHPIGRYADFVYVQEAPLFVHQFPQAYMDLRERRDAAMDYFHNSRLATLAQRQFSLDLRNEFPAWSEQLWGITASDSETGYKAWGGPPRTWGFNRLDGTIVPCATAGSLPFCPEETLMVLRNLRENFGDRLWKRYGFVDAFNPHTGWVNPDVIGIDLGISMIQAENLRTGLIWRLFMQSPEARLALEKSGLLSTRQTVAADQRTRLLERAAEAWEVVRLTPVPSALHLTALIAARDLALVSPAEAVAAARAALSAPVVADARQLAFHAAGWITVRQALPGLAAEASRHLDAIAWESAAPEASAHLGSSDRLLTFLQIATATRPPDAWAELSRETIRIGPVLTLAPAEAAGLLLPGLWLDEGSILPGAAASQLAYARLTTPGAELTPTERILILDTFPAESLSRGIEPEPAGATPDEAAAALITIANLLADGSIRKAFQADPLVVAGRTAIAEFGEAAFGPHTSVIANRELGPEATVVPQRVTQAVRSTTPREDWVWHDVSGDEYNESLADVRPGDPSVSFRFTFTWDDTALYLHAEVTDSDADFVAPPERKRVIELFIDPAGDGFEWAGVRDYQFVFGLGVDAAETFNQAPTQAEVRMLEHGYTVEAAIPWTSIGVKPAPGLEFGISPAVIAEGNREWLATVKLNWSYAAVSSAPSRLGRILLQ